MDRQGLELETVTSCNDKGLRESPESGAAKSGAILAESVASDPDLEAFIRAWPTLPERVKRAVLAMVKAATSSGE
jgi:hypothetical protein